MRQKFVLVKLVKSFRLFGVERTVHKGDLLAVYDSIRYIYIERGGLKSQRFCASTEFVAVACGAAANKPDCHPACGKDTSRLPSSGSSCPPASPGRCDRHNLGFLSAKSRGKIHKCVCVCV